jgi:hypothetical protein
MMHRMLLLALVACLPAAGSALAQDRQAARKACMTDFRTHCRGVVPGGGRVAKCLSDNLDKLTPDCKAALAANAAANGKAAQPAEPATRP